MICQYPVTPSCLLGMRLISDYFDRPSQSGRVVDYYLEPGGKRSIALFFVHGGGWQAGSRLHYHRLMEWFGSHGFVSASTDYRLGRGLIREQIEDVRLGLCHFRRELKKTLDDQAIVIVGSSAGAHLALLSAMTAPGVLGEEVPPLVREEWKQPVACVVQAAPVRFEEWDDIFPGILSNMRDIIGREYTGNESLWQHFAPLTHLRSGLPPFFFLNAENEHMFPLPHIDEFATHAESLGVDVQQITYQNAEHGFLYGTERRIQKKALQDVLEFLEKIEK